MRRDGCGIDRESREMIVSGREMIIFGCVMSLSIAETGASS